MTEEELNAAIAGLPLISDMPETNGQMACLARAA